MAATAPDKTASFTDEDRLRADMYALLAELLRKEPSDEVISTVAGFQGDGSEIGSASSVLATLAGKLSGDEIRDEYIRPRRMMLDRK